MSPFSKILLSLVLHWRIFGFVHFHFSTRFKSSEMLSSILLSAQGAMVQATIIILTMAIYVWLEHGLNYREIIEL